MALRGNGRFCNLCGRPLKDHFRITSKSPRICMLEFSVMNSSGTRRIADPETRPEGILRTRHDYAAWVTPERAM